MQRIDSFEKTLMLSKTEITRRRVWQRMRWLDCVTYVMEMNLRKLWEIVRDREAWHAAVYGFLKNWTQLGNWTTTSHSGPLRKNFKLSPEPFIIILFLLTFINFRNLFLSFSKFFLNCKTFICLILASIEIIIEFFSPFLINCINWFSNIKPLWYSWNIPN